MIVVIQILALFAAIIVSLTVLSLLNDQPRLATSPGLPNWVRFHGRRLGLVLMGAGAAMVVLTVLTGQTVSLEVVVLISAIALRQVSHPKGWVAFVRHGESTGAPSA